MHSVLLPEYAPEIVPVTLCAKPYELQAIALDQITDIVVDRTGNALRIRTSHQVVPRETSSRKPFCHDVHRSTSFDRSLDICPPALLRPKTSREY